MKTEDVKLHKEGTAEGYLGVDIQQDSNTITFAQIGLTKHIIEALGLDSKFTTAVATPAEKQHWEKMSMVLLLVVKLTMPV